MSDPVKLDSFGHLLEGTLEQDPMTDAYVLRTTDNEGRPVSVNVSDILARHVGREIRLTVATFEALDQLARLVEDSGGGMVQGIRPEDVPVPFNIQRKG